MTFWATMILQLFIIVLCCAVGVLGQLRGVSGWVLYPCVLLLYVVCRIALFVFVFNPERRQR